MRAVSAVLLWAVGLFGQTPPPLQQPWEGVPPSFRNIPIGRLEIPKTTAEWKVQRTKVKAIVVRSLGELPPRPSPLKVRTIRVDRRDG